MKTYLATTFILFFSFYSFNQCVICNSLEEALKDTLRPVSLDLSAQGLKEFPMEINKLKNLQELNLSDNQILEIDFSNLNLPRLTSLNVSNNAGFNGASLDGISNSLPNLTHLDLSANSLYLLDPEIGDIQGLTHLYLNDNNLEFFNSDLNQMHQLKYLNLENNNIVDQPMLFAQLWNLEELNVAGNNNLYWKDLSESLLFKNHLRKIKTSVPNILAIPKSFKKIPIKELHLVETNIYKQNSSISQNDSLEILILENCSISNPDMFYSWIGRFENLKKLEFREMNIPKGIKNIHSVEEIVFDNCEFEDKAELMKIKPQINITSKNSDISNGDFVGNSQKMRTINIPDNEYTEKNTLTPMKEIESQEFIMQSDQSNKIDLGFSSYEIPENAFLDKSGSVYNGPLTINIKELNDPIINAVAGVPMIYNNGSDQLFSSSGMIDFRAEDDKGNELYPNPENIIMVEMKDLQPAQSTDLYVFNPQTNNWQVIGKPQSTNLDSLRRVLMNELLKISDQDIVGVRTIPIVITFKYKKRRYDPTELSFDYRGIKIPKNTRDRNSKNFYTKNIDQREVCRGTWKLDTIHSIQLDSLLKVSKKEQNEIRKILKKSNMLYSDVPRIITNLSITPNIERDDYVLSFYYRDKKYSLPVYKQYNGTIEAIQRKEKKEYFQYSKKTVKADKEAAKLKLKQDKYIKEQADIIRKKMVEGLLRNESALKETVDKLRFGLSSFGLVNCDYFSRNVPTANIVLDSMAIDQDGNLVHVPFEIRNIVLDDNTFVSTNNRSFPIFERMRSIPIFALGALEVCVVKAWKKMANGLHRAEVFRFSTENLSSDEVRNKIVGT